MQQQFTLTIAMDNAAFADDPAGELARILRVTADRLDDGEDRREGFVQDVNGNRVGTWTVSA